MQYLKEKIVPFDPMEARSADELVRSLRRCSFQGRALAQALDVWERMCRDGECLRVMSLAGAMVPAGMGLIIVRLIEAGLLDVVVCTGATAAHDMCNSVESEGQAHFLGDPYADDTKLRAEEIDRVYDTYISEQAFYDAEDVLDGLLPRLKYDRSEKDIRLISTHAFCRQIGGMLPGGGLLRAAAAAGVVVFIPAVSDSELGLNVVAANERGIVDGARLVFDTLSDVEEFGRLICTLPRAGLVSIGGGVPRNWAQQIYPYLNMKTRPESAPAEGYHYGVRITTDRPEFGGLSGCTISESKSWGKYEKDAVEASVICDATIALPLLASALLERLGLRK